jgi:glycosyltransferase involved in cell wall biosynthesis
VSPPEEEPGTRQEPDREPAPEHGPARLLFLINSLGTGGAERQLALTVARLDRTRFDPVVACLFSGGPYLHEIEEAGVPVRSPGLPKGLREARAGAARLVEELRPDLVHTAMFEANVAGRLAAARAGIPVVSHATNLYESPARYTQSAVPRWKLLAARSLERRSARRSRVHVVAVGEAVAASAAAYLRLPPRRITVVRRGFDAGELRAEAERDLDGPAWPDGASARLLAVGRLAPQKGHRHLLEAMPEVLGRHPRAHLALAGAGPLEGALRTLAARLDLQGAVTFLGVRRDVPALLARADAFVLPSLWEGAAGALVEAMLLGVPAAVTDDAPLREVAREDARFFPPADPAGIARAVESILADPPAARARGVAAAHDIERNTRRLQDLYATVLTAGRPEPRDV